MEGRMAGKERGKRLLPCMIGDEEGLCMIGKVLCRILRKEDGY